VTAADRPYGEFYGFYSVSPENFGSTHVQSSKLEGKVWQPAVNVEGFNFIYCGLNHHNQTKH